MGRPIWDRQALRCGLGLPIRVVEYSLSFLVSKTVFRWRRCPHGVYMVCCAHSFTNGPLKFPILSHLRIQRFTMANSSLERLCAVCRESFTLTNMFRTRCRHWICSDCLDTLFKLAMTDATFYPPSCCVLPLPTNAALRRLPTTTARQYTAKWIELSTRKKTYCHRPDCSTFIAPHSIHNGNAFCQKCRGITCSKCKAVAHFGPCTTTEHAESMQLARVEKWQRCPGCGRIVERTEGCAEMK